MHKGYVLLDIGNMNYLESGRPHAALWERTKNPLFAHIYRNPEDAFKLGKSMMQTVEAHRQEFKGSPNYKNLPQNPIQLVVATLTSNGHVEEGDPIPTTPVLPEGFVVRIKATRKEGHSPVRDTFTDFFKSFPWTREEKSIENQHVYDTLARGSKPKVWKTAKSAEKVVQQLLLAKACSVWDYKFDVVPSSEAI